MTFWSTSYSCCLDRFILWHFPQALHIHSLPPAQLRATTPPSTPRSHAAALLPLFSQVCSILQLFDLSEPCELIEEIIAKTRRSSRKANHHKMSWRSCCRRASSSLPESKQRDVMMILSDRSTFSCLPNLFIIQGATQWFYLPNLILMNFSKKDGRISYITTTPYSFAMWFTPLP